MALTKDGFTIKRLAELKKEYDNLLTNRFGPINTEPDSVIGQLEGIWAEALANLYEQAQDTYHAMYPFSAEGVSLDGAVSFIGLSRFRASATQVTTTVYGRESTELQNGVQASDGKIHYHTLRSAIISRTNAVDTYFTINVKSNCDYFININAKSYSYRSKNSASLTEIIQGLASLLQPAEGLSIEEKNQQLHLYAKDYKTPFSVAVDDQCFTLAKLGSPALFVAMQEGRIILPAGALTNIVTPRSGWDAVINHTAGLTGRDRETDEELRQRFEKTRQNAGSATLRAIRAALLQEVRDVHEVYIFENRTNQTSADGIPPHAFEALVAGGEDHTIAEVIWKNKPAGIQTYGTHSMQVIDENGDGQQVRFSRATPKYAWVQIQIKKINPEEKLSVTVLDNIKQAVMDYGIHLDIGEDIILQKMIGPIYANTTGLAEIIISAGVTAKTTDTPNYHNQNISIDKRAFALFDPQRVKVVGL